MFDLLIELKNDMNMICGTCWMSGIYVYMMMYVNDLRRIMLDLGLYDDMLKFISCNLSMYVRFMIFVD